MNSFRWTVVHIVANITWRAEIQAERLVLIILGYIFLMLVGIPLHRKVLKIHKKIDEDLVYLYDDLRYKLAKAQYENPSIQGEKWIKVIMETHKENYIENAAIIQQEITAIEQTLWQEIITSDEWRNINKQVKKKKRLLLCVHILGRPITLLTASIYKLFW